MVSSILTGMTVAAAAHIAPMIGTVTPMRRRFLTRLSGIGRSDHIALTFDDGPDPKSTPFFLSELELRDVRATFFVLGSMAVRCRAMVRDMAEQGHEIGVHGWVHRNTLTRSPATVMRDVARTYDLIGDITGTAPTLYRPPYGVLSASSVMAAHQVGLRTVLWSSWARDWQRTATPARCLATVTGALRGGGTVLLHDSDCTSSPGSWQITLELLPGLLDHCAEHGWSSGSLREHG